MFRAVKAAGLMHELERDGARYRLVLTGPAAEFLVRPTRYGVRFARVLPVLARSPGWRVSADVLRNGQPCQLRLSGRARALAAVAPIGGEPRRFKPMIDLYRDTGARFGHTPDQLKVGLHALGYVARTKKEAADDYFPGYARAVDSVAKERGWAPATRAGFDAQLGPDGALLIGEPDEVAEKILRHSETLGGISRITFQMNAASLPQDKMLRAIEMIGAHIAPKVRET